MVGYRQIVNLGDDVQSSGTVSYETEDYVLVAIDAKRDENFLQVIPYGDMTISGRGPITYTEFDTVDDHKAGQNSDGSWPQMRRDCGLFKHGYVNDLNHYRTKRFTCHLQGCPKCFRIWARRQAESAAGYLWAFFKKYNRPIAHWVLSPSIQKVSEFGDDGWALWKWLDSQLRKFVNTFSEMNDTVVAPIRHPMRKKCPVCGQSSEDGVRCKSCCVDLVWYWSPHLHVSSDFRFSYDRAIEYAAFENQEQCIFTQVSIPPDQEELANQIAYELGHALYIEGQSIQAIRYMGKCAKNHYRTEKQKVKTDMGEPEVKLDGYVDNHTFYQLRDSSVEESVPGVVKVHKFNGNVQLERDIYGKRIPLQKTTWYYELTELGQWLNGRWVRYTLPRKLKKPVERKVWDTIAWEKKFLNL